MLNKQTTLDFIDKFWSNDIIPALSDFIKIPCITKTLDQKWEENGHLLEAANLAKKWIEKQNLPGTKVQVLTMPGKTPFVFAEIPGTASSSKTALLYGHLDKMPDVAGWDDGLSAWNPVIREGNLYGRGSVDDGYAIFIPIAALKTLQQQNIPYPRCVILLEASEECGSPDFDSHFKLLEKSIGTPDLIMINDTSGEDHKHLWLTNSLRGVVLGALRVETLTQGVHSGTGSGIAASTFRIARLLLSRIENEQTGEVLVKECYSDIPQERIEETQELAKILKDRVYKDVPFIDGVKPISEDITELLLNKNWRPTLSILGADGLPSVGEAGNVLRPMTTLKISLRLAPSANPDKVAAKVKEILERDPPYGAKVTYTLLAAYPGWDAPKSEPWFAQVLTSVSNSYFGNNPMYKGEGASIGIVQMLGEKYPKAQFVASGIMIPASNEHGPNESISLSAAKKYNCCIAEILATLAEQK